MQPRRARREQRARGDDVHACDRWQWWRWWRGRDARWRGGVAEKRGRRQASRSVATGLNEATSTTPDVVRTRITRNVERESLCAPQSAQRRVTLARRVVGAFSEGANGDSCLRLLLHPLPVPRADDPDLVAHHTTHRASASFFPVPSHASWSSLVVPRSSVVADRRVCCSAGQLSWCSPAAADLDERRLSAPARLSAASERTSRKNTHEQHSRRRMRNIHAMSEMSMIVPVVLPSPFVLFVFSSFLPFSSRSCVLRRGVTAERQRRPDDRATREDQGKAAGSSREGERPAHPRTTATPTPAPSHSLIHRDQPHRQQREGSRQ